MRANRHEVKKKTPGAALRQLPRGDAPGALRAARSSCVVFLPLERPRARQQAAWIREQQALVSVPPQACFPYAAELLVLTRALLQAWAPP
jgi:hypothetical protein